LDYNAKQVSPRRGLPQDKIDWVFAGSFGAPHPGLAETDLFDFFRSHMVSSDMVNPVSRPKQLIDQHCDESTMTTSGEQVRTSLSDGFNIVTAKQIGVTLFSNVLARADRVIR